MGVIKGVLKEELENSERMLKRYQEEINKIKGCLVEKVIANKRYYYIAIRHGKKVKFIYKGPVSKEIKEAYAEQRKKYLKYQELLKRIKKQIIFLRRALRGKEAV